MRRSLLIDSTGDLEPTSLPFESLLVNRDAHPQCTFSFDVYPILDFDQLASLLYAEMTFIRGATGREMDDWNHVSAKEIRKGNPTIGDVEGLDEAGVGRFF